MAVGGLPLKHRGPKWMGEGGGVTQTCRVLLHDQSLMGYAPHRLTALHDEPSTVRGLERWLLQSAAARRDD